MIGPELVLYTEGHRVTGTIATGAQRLSDFFNDPKTELLHLQQATYQAMLRLTEPVSAGRLTVRKDQVALVVPLDTPDSGGRVQTERVEVHLGCSLFTIVGSLHRRPSDPPDMIGEATRTFIPVSDARMTYLPSRELDADVSVVLVHVGKIQFWSIPGSSTPALRLVF